MSAIASLPTRTILGIPFFVGTTDEAVRRTLAGGLVVAPSGPGLAGDLRWSPTYREAVSTADVAITDSGYLILLWRLLSGEKLPRLSGLKFLRALLDRAEMKAPGAIFWVMPSPEDSARNQTWLRNAGFAISENDIYLAPRYPAGDIADPELLAKLRTHPAQLVLICIGGGVQERLGLMLRRELAGRRLPGIACLGAAIAFITGGQANIPSWADRLMLGWFFRLAQNPRVFGPRYLAAMRLAPLLWRNRDRLPPLEQS